MAERGSLVERMAQARERAAQARGRSPVWPAAATAPGTQPAALASQPMPWASRPMGLSAAGAAAAAWRLPGAPGQHLVLMPGQLYFGQQAASVRTLLGSCVALTLWHPQRRLGGMCHFLLPSRTRKAGEPVDGRYGDEAIATLVQQISANATEPTDYEVHVYGGADTLPDGHGSRFNVGERNIELAWRLVDHYGFRLQGVDVGEDIPRRVVLCLGTGAVDMARCQGRAQDAAAPSVRRANLAGEH